MTATTALVLVESAAHQGGHWQQAAVRLCQQATAQGMRCVLVASGVPAPAREQLEAAGARLVRRPAGPTGWLLAGTGAAVTAVAGAGRRMTRHRRWPHQLAALGQAFAEAAALRTAAAAVTGPRLPVLLSAGGVLHGLVAALASQPHLRIVHETPTSEDRPLRWLTRQARHAEPRVMLLCPTETVRRQAIAGHPRLATVVWSFALADAEPPLAETERASARAAYGLTPDAVALALVGGWWPHKDVATLVDALNRLTRPVTVLVAGYPLDPGLLARLRKAAGGRLVVHPGPVSRKVIRRVYAAADATVVARRAGVGKESGLVADAAVLGVPLLVSDHDPALTSRLAGQPWVRVFPAGDPAGLAAAITDLRSRRLPPGPAAAGALGLPTAAATIAAYTAWYTTLTKEESLCPSR